MKQARLCCGSSAHAGECEKRVAGRSRLSHSREFQAILWTRSAGGPNVLRVHKTSLGRRQAIALLTVKEIFDLVRDDLLLVEEELARQSEAAFPPVSEITAYLLGGGRKRLRPALLLLSASYAGRKDRAAIWLSSGVEFFHIATLIHDDVVDSARATRR